MAPGSMAPLAIVPVLASVGVSCGGLAAAGVGAGLAFVESTRSSSRTAALLVGGALGGGAVGLLVQLLARWSLSVLVGVHVDVGGGFEGLVIGGAAGVGYGLGTDGMAESVAPLSGRQRLIAASLTAAACGVAALGLAWTGRTLVGGTIHAIAQASIGGQAVLTPLARLVGEPDFGPFTATLVSIGEGALFGFGLTRGLTHQSANLTDIS
jgi:hypothetical protein